MCYIHLYSYGIDYIPKSYCVIITCLLIWPVYYIIILHIRLLANSHSVCLTRVQAVVAS